MANSALGRLGDAIERLVVNPTYRQFQRAVLIVTAVLVATNAVVRFGIVPLGPGLTNLLWGAGAVALAVFLLTGLIQVVAMGRYFERGSDAVATAATELETAAEEVEQTAEELEETAETVESAAEEVDEAAAGIDTAAETIDEAASEVDAEPPVDPDEAKETAHEVEERAETAREKTSEVQDRTTEVKARTERAKEAAKDVTGGAGGDQLQDGEGESGGEDGDETETDERDKGR